MPHADFEVFLEEFGFAMSNSIIQSFYLCVKNVRVRAQGCMYENSRQQYQVLVGACILSRPMFGNHMPMSKMEAALQTYCLVGADNSAHLKHILFPISTYPQP